METGALEATLLALNNCILFLNIFFLSDIYNQAGTNTQPFMLQTHATGHAKATDENWAVWRSYIQLIHETGSA